MIGLVKAALTNYYGETGLEPEADLEPTDVADYLSEESRWSALASATSPAAWQEYDRRRYLYAGHFVDREYLAERRQAAYQDKPDRPTQSENLGLFWRNLSSGESIQPLNGTGIPPPEERRAPRRHRMRQNAHHLP